MYVYFHSTETVQRATDPRDPRDSKSTTAPLPPSPPPPPPPAQPAPPPPAPASSSPAHGRPGADGYSSRKREGGGWGCLGTGMLGGLLGLGDIMEQGVTEAIRLGVASWSSWFRCSWLRGTWK